MPKRAGNREAEETEIVRDYSAQLKNQMPEAGIRKLEKCVIRNPKYQETTRFFDYKEKQ